MKAATAEDIENIDERIKSYKPSKKEKEEGSFLATQVRVRDTLEQESQQFARTSSERERLIERSARQEEKTHNQAREFLDLNPEGLSALTVEDFVGLFEKRQDLKDRINKIDSELIGGCKITARKLAEKIKSKEKPEITYQTDGSYYLDGSNDVVNGAADAYVRAIGAGMDARPDLFEQIRELSGSLFELSPRAYIETGQRLTDEVEKIIEEYKAQLEQELQEFDDRMKAGNFTFEEPAAETPSEETEGQ